VKQHRLFLGDESRRPKCFEAFQENYCYVKDPGKMEARLKFHGLQLVRSVSPLEFTADAVCSMTSLVTEKGLQAQIRSFRALDLIFESDKDRVRCKLPWDPAWPALKTEKDSWDAGEVKGDNTVALEPAGLRAPCVAGEVPSATWDPVNDEMTDDELDDEGVLPTPLTSRGANGMVPKTPFLLRTMMLARWRRRPAASPTSLPKLRGLLLQQPALMLGLLLQLAPLPPNLTTTTLQL